MGNDDDFAPHQSFDTFDQTISESDALAGSPGCRKCSYAPFAEEPVAFSVAGASHTSASTGFRRPSLNFLISLRGSRRLPGHSEEIFGVDSKEMLQCRSIFGAQLDCAKFTGHE